ncbi:uncharacterized protein TNCV_5008601 [Trichonephila clavipes]|nr:uncharacterized protein TNCV_5008601 [Trichonephila clavipes]
MSACGREFYIACIRSKGSSFEAAGRRSRTRRRPTKSHTCSIDDIPVKKAGQGRSCMCWAEQKSRTIFATCGRALSCSKIAPGMP